MKRWAGLWMLRGMVCAVGLLVGIGAVACGEKASPREAPRERARETTRQAPRQAPGITAKVRCRIPAATLARIKSVSALLEMSESDKKAWFTLLLQKCTGWPGAIKLVLHMAAPGPAEQKLRMPTATKVQGKELDRLMNQACPGLVPRMVVAYDKPRPGAAGRIWEHCKITRWRLISKREWGHGLWRNALVLVTYRLLKNGGMTHAVARTLARLLAMRGRVNQKEGEMMLVRNGARTESVLTTELQVSAATILVDNTPIANVKNGKVDANTKRDGPNGYFIDPLYKKLKVVLAKRRAAAKKAGQILAPELLLTVHGRTPFRLVAEVLYSSLQAGFTRMQLSVHSNRATDAVVIVDVVTGPLTAKPMHVRMTPTAYTLHNRGGALASTHPARAFKATAARAALAKALHARAVKGKQSAATRGVIHIHAADTIPYSDVIRLLDALRVHPGAAGKGGCPLLFNAKKSTWAPAVNIRPRCMMYRPRLFLFVK